METYDNVEYLQHENHPKNVSFKLRTIAATYEKTDRENEPNTSFLLCEYFRNWVRTMQKM